MTKKNQIKFADLIRSLGFRYPKGIPQCILAQEVADIFYYSKPATFSLSKFMYYIEKGNLKGYNK